MSTASDQKLNLLIRRLGTTFARGAAIVIVPLFIGLMIVFPSPKLIVLGIIYTIGGLVYATGSERSEIDFLAKTYRIYVSVFGFRIGKSKPLPGIDCILVRDRNLTEQNHSFFDVLPHYEVTLWYGKRRIVMMLSKDKEDVGAAVQQLRNGLNVELRDNTRDRSFLQLINE